MSNDVINNLVLTRLNIDRIKEIEVSAEKMISNDDNKITAISHSEKENLINAVKIIKTALKEYEERCVFLLKK